MNRSTLAFLELMLEPKTCSKFLTKPQRKLVASPNCPLLQVEITAGPQLYVRTGSRLQLECLVTRAVEAPQWVMWQHGDMVTPGKAGSIFSPKIKHIFS